ncbi:MAG: hypothetical protein KGY80_12180 [Candidatus Thorarchaeota archaeon]|nr:hypothetical protein [Candidatus Thorarchaeota archaeon]
MKIGEKPSLANMDLADMFGLWWDVPWVRYLVLSFIPIGIIDGVYTSLLFAAHGPEFEYNLLVRLAFTNDFGMVWIIINIVSFALFTMLAGSYYLHTRTNVFGNRTRWLSLIISIRMGTALHNMLAYYWIPEAPLLAMLGAFLLYIGMNILLNRDRDVSMKGVKRYFKAKYDRFHDALLTRGINPTSEGDLQNVNEEKNDENSEKATKWAKRIAYMLTAIIVFVAIPFVLVGIARFTGASDWSGLFGDIFYWNYVSGPTFIMGFVMILGAVGIAVYLIFKAFDTGKGAW